MLLYEIYYILNETNDIFEILGDLSPFVEHHGMQTLEQGQELY